MEWIYKVSDPLWQTLLACLAIFFLIVIVTRIIGLRSFAKFTTYDFAFTIATGSLIASILTASITLTHGFFAIFGLLSTAMIFSFLQKKYSFVNDAISNKALLLMDGSEILYDNLKSARIQETQLYAKLREANVTNFDQVLAVVLESTGDISVLHKSNSAENINFDRSLLKGVSEKK